MRRAVAITGVGVVSAIGSDAASFWDACLEGRTAVARIPEHWHDFADYHCTVWSPLEVDLRASGFSRVELAQNDPVTLLAAMAAHEALDAAGHEAVLHDARARAHRLVGVDPVRGGVFMGTGLGGGRSLLENHAYQVLARTREALLDAKERMAGEGEALDAIISRLHHGPRFNPFVVSMLMPNAVSAFQGIRFGLHGANRTYSLACASGTVAIGQAFEAVRDGSLDLALAGASEFLDDHYGGIFAGFDVARTLIRDHDDADRANRPFDVDRSGFLFAQGGSAVLVLEPLEQARARGAPVVAEIAGYAETFDAHSLMSIGGDGAQIERMLHGALEDAALTADAVGLVNAHGTGTESNDAIESAVIERVFGRRVPVNATKSLVGHTIGASGAIEAAVAAFSLRDQRTHGCRNLERPIAALDFVRGARAIDAEAAVSQSFAFGGHNACLVLKRGTHA